MLLLLFLLREWSKGIECNKKVPSGAMLANEGGEAFLSSVIAFAS
jgi:hypothetical protein